MGRQYAGDPNATWPEDYYLPDDGDSLDAASVNVAFEALGDRTSRLKAKSPRLKSVGFNGEGGLSKSWVVPARCTLALLLGCGGGGGGGGGGAGAAGGGSTQGGGGGGGGGALVTRHLVYLTPGDTIAILIGAGGIGGTAGTFGGATAGGNGGDGGNTTFTSATNVLSNFTFYGAGGGIGGANLGEEGDAPGGQPVKPTSALARVELSADEGAIVRALLGPQFGGWGRGMPGGGSGIHAGGVGGAPHTNVVHGDHGGGGGGGASGFQFGVTSGRGGDASTAVGRVGPTAGTWGGGGGGGGGGRGGDSAHAGRAGGNGVIEIVWVEDEV
ncbi:MAG: hypothetical protein J0I07_07875 [Myxococcales bacterium]|nr:hypothetical protein [Myxococcales bacterium]